MKWELEKVIRAAIPKPSGDITRGDLADITLIFDDSGAITNLEGIQHCANLTTLQIQYSSGITDISMLSTIFGA